MDGVVAVGEAVEVAEGVMGVMGVVGTCEELTRLAAEVEVGVAAVEGLEKKHQSRGSQRAATTIPKKSDQYLYMITINTGQLFFPF